MHLTSEQLIFVVTKYLRTGNFKDIQQLLEELFEVLPTKMTIWRKSLFKFLFFYYYLPLDGFQWALYSLQNFQFQLQPNRRQRETNENMFSDTNYLYFFKKNKNLTMGIIFTETLCIEFENPKYVNDLNYY